MELCNSGDLGTTYNTGRTTVSPCSILRGHTESRYSGWYATYAVKPPRGHTKQNSLATFSFLHLFLHFMSLFSFQGAWRKITVTDNLPILKKPSAAPKPKENQETSLSSGESDRKEVKEENKDDEGEISEVLLPRTANTCELWPIILTKAILKVAALE